MVKVMNIKHKSLGINLAKSEYKHLQHLVPAVNHKLIEFELHDTNTAIANAIRRLLINEIPVKYISASISDIISSDKYIISDVIKQRLEMIPIAQSVDVDSEFSLKFENTTDTYCNVYVSEIKSKKYKSDIFISEIPICSINAQCSITISNIRVLEGFGYNNGRIGLGTVAYEIINHDMTQASINTDPSTFKLAFETTGNINPDDIIRLGLRSLISRFKNLDKTNFTTEFDIFKLSIDGETHTMGNLIAKYVYDIDPTIEYVAMRIIHPSKRECVIDIRHSQASKLLDIAVDNIINDLNTILESF